MIKKNYKALLVIVLVLFLTVVTGFGLKNSYVSADESDRLDELNKQISEYEQELKRLKLETNTLTNQIAQFDAQINLTTSKILQTEEKINLLGSRIDRLTVSLDSLSEAFHERTSETYKMRRVSDPVYMILGSDDLSEAMMRFNYLLLIQEEDRNLLSRLENTQTTYKAEREDQQVLQEELEGQKQVLGTQKAAKNELLSVTRNDEKRYQNLLAKATAERDAIQAIIAGKGEETEVGSINEGERIASVIGGPSACSSGAHLHLEVTKNSINQNPASYLSSRSVIWDNSPDGEFAFTGNWPWPLNDPIRVTQGYGMTYFASVLRYYGGAPHTGIDMVNNGDYTVKAVRPGTLYRGSIGCGGGTLRYVRIKQADDISSYYLHVNY